MYIDNDVPFFPNTSDATHCYQASFKMILKHFQPEKDYGWEQLDKITAKQKDMWTWSLAGLCWLTKNGFDVVNIEVFDYERFSKEKIDYFIEFYGEDVAKESMKHSNFDGEYEWAKELIRTVKNELRLPNIDDIQKFLDEGWLLIANVNHRSLYKESGYVGHFVVIKGYDDDSLIFHDPGPVASSDVSMTYSDFKNGWDYPTKNSRNLICIQPKTI
jgi:hypothetical protein